MNREKSVIYGTMIMVLLLAAVSGVLFLHPKSGISCNVTFRDYDGTILKTEVVRYGEAASAPAVPGREGYIFAGWSVDFSSIIKDTVITAEYIRITETTFRVDTIVVTPDIREAEIKVSVANNPGILGMLISLEYDETALKLVDCQTGSALSALTFQKPSKYSSGCNFVWYGSEAGEVTDGEMLTLTFEIADHGKSGTYPITISWNDRDIYDSNCDMLNPDVVQGAIVVSE